MHSFRRELAELVPVLLEPDHLLAGLGKDQPGFHDIRRIKLGERDHEMSGGLSGETRPRVRNFTEDLLPDVESSARADIAVDEREFGVLLASLEVRASRELAEDDMDKRSRRVRGFDVDARYLLCECGLDLVGKDARCSVTLVYRHLSALSLERGRRDCRLGVGLEMTEELFTTGVAGDKRRVGLAEAVVVEIDLCAPTR